MLARVAERQKVDARAATLLAHAVPACAAGSSDNASAVAVSVPAVSLLQRGKSRANLCASNAGSPAKGPQSTAASFAGDPLPQLESGGKKSQAQLVIERLPLVQILQGQSLGRTLTPAYGQVEKWKLDQDEKVRNGAAVLALHLGQCEAAGKLVNEVAVMSAPALEESLRNFKNHKVELPKQLKDQVVARRVKQLCRAEDYKGLLQVAAPWKSENMRAQEWDPLDPHSAHVEGGSKEKAFTYANVLAEDVLLTIIKQEKAGTTKCIAFCKLALESFDQIDEEIDDEFAAVLDSLLHLFRCLLALLHPRPGVFGSSYDDVRMVVMDSFSSPLSTSEPWLMTVAVGLKAVSVYRDLMHNFLDTHEVTSKVWPALLKLFESEDEEEPPSMSNEDMKWAYQNMVQWRASLRKGLGQEVEAKLLVCGRAFVAATM